MFIELSDVEVKALKSGLEMMLDVYIEVSDDMATSEIPEEVGVAQENEIYVDAMRSVANKLGMKTNLNIPDTVESLL